VSSVAEVAAALRLQADALEAQARALRAQAGALEAVSPARVTPPAPMASMPPLLDKRELARALGVSVATIDRLDREGQPFLRVGDVKRYDLATVHAWHRERSVPVPPSAPPHAAAPLPAPEPSGVRLLSRRRGGSR
jgi:hypothetical protein